MNWRAHVTQFWYDSTDWQFRTHLCCQCSHLGTHCMVGGVMRSLWNPHAYSLLCSMVAPTALEPWWLQALRGPRTEHGTVWRETAVRLDSTCEAHSKMSSRTVHVQHRWKKGFTVRAFSWCQLSDSSGSMNTEQLEYLIAVLHAWGENSVKGLPLKSLLDRLGVTVLPAYACTQHVY